MHLYETHLPVTNTEASAKFYVDTVGLEFAYRDPGRDIVFLWIGTDRRSMLGLWGPATTYGSHPHRCHLAIALSLQELLLAGEGLNGVGVSTRNRARKRPSRRSLAGCLRHSFTFETRMVTHLSSSLCLMMHLTHISSAHCLRGDLPPNALQRNAHRVILLGE